MDFLSRLFQKKEETTSVVLIDIRADSVAGAYAFYRPGALPTIVYARRLPIEGKREEKTEKAMLRALKLLLSELVSEGAPALARATGSGHAKRVLISFDAPWQQTSIRTEAFEEKEPFTFTKSMLDKRLKKEEPSSETLLADQSIVATMLNGYVTMNPYGKQAHRASVIVLTSLIEKETAAAVVEALEDAYHSKDILPIAGSSLRYQALRTLFPHEQDALILDATGHALTTVALVRKNLLMSMARVATPLSTSAWIADITKEFATIAQHYPLPRTIFVLSDEEDGPNIKEALAGANTDLWLSDQPPKVVLVKKSHLASFVKQASADDRPDLAMLLMALYDAQVAEKARQAEDLL